MWPRRALPSELLTVDERLQAVQSPAWRTAQLEGGEELAGAFGEQVRGLVDDAVLGQDRVDAVLDRRTHPGQRRAVTQQLAQLAQREVGLRKHAGAQQLRQRAGIEGVGLDPRRGDRARSERMREVQVIAGILEQLGRPLPAVGRLQRDVRPTVTGVAEQRQERVAVVGDPPRLGSARHARRRSRCASGAGAGRCRPSAKRRSWSVLRSNVRPRGRNPRDPVMRSGRRTDHLPRVTLELPAPWPFMTSSGRISGRGVSWPRRNGAGRSRSGAEASSCSTTDQDSALTCRADRCLAAHVRWSKGVSKKPV